MKKKNVFVTLTEENSDAFFKFMEKEKIEYLIEEDENFKKMVKPSLISMDENKNQKILEYNKLISDIIFYGTPLEKITEDSGFEYHSYGDYADIGYSDEPGAFFFSSFKIFEFPESNEYKKPLSINDVMEWDGSTYDSEIETDSLEFDEHYELEDNNKPTKIKTIGMRNKNEQ